MSEAARKLVSWRLAQDLSQREAAELAGLTKAAWQSYESGASPKAPAIAAIQSVTNGAVSLQDWTESEQDKAVRRARASSKRVRRARRSTPLPRRTGTEG